MTREQKFIMLVQTAAIVESISRTPWLHQASRSEFASMAVDIAIEVTERGLPDEDELAQLCQEHIAYVFAHTSEPMVVKPQWLIGLI